MYLPRTSNINLVSDNTLTQTAMEFTEHLEPGTFFYWDTTEGFHLCMVLSQEADWHRAKAYDFTLGTTIAQPYIDPNNPNHKLMVTIADVTIQHKVQLVIGD